ncbi:putative 2-ketoarginine decarboxylase AruI [Pseudomonas extremaustralis]|uniref:Putative 2-ketoarginine decarboxylase AruI n=1 Tax=Pseudomonas extremaustralis TaxID=359110 RepID=A0A5M9IRI3_9PSED|nr:5-guanidino-2-oxopentanoate decarboxylase [Pseudomonas extremaustralis]KAA8558316.1 putative 2-ketoarginine decarboxylase AruI [Pseudomonas extremaustralis]
MSEAMSCGSKLMHLLRAYDIDTLFGMPGVHTLEAYRGMDAAGIRHIGVRHEQGAGFMADGYARVSGKPGVCLVISGPGVTNAATPIGQAYSDSVPVLMLTSVGATNDHGMGRGRLHEVTDQSRITEPLTAFSVIANDPLQVREYVARAFALFESERPRPVHISIPLDVFKLSDNQPVQRRRIRQRLAAAPSAVTEAVTLLRAGKRPLIIAGGGCTGAAAALLELVTLTGAVVVPTIAGKGVLPDSHPRVLEATLDREATQTLIASADVVLCVGTELAEPDIWLQGNLPMGGPMIRIDIDAATLVRDYDAAVSLQADASLALHAIVEQLRADGFSGTGISTAEVASVRAAERAALRPIEQQHIKVLEALRAAMPADGIVFADMTQLAYTGYAFYPCEQPRQWFFPAGYGTLGYALPAAIGGKLAAPERAMMVIVGDGGFQFTLQELGTAVEQRLPMAIILWNNDSLAQIRDGMLSRDIPTIGVNQHNPDFLKLAEAYGCLTARPDSLAALQQAVRDAHEAQLPTVIEVRESADFLSVRP